MVQRSGNKPVVKKNGVVYVGTLPVCRLVKIRGQTVLEFKDRSTKRSKERGTCLVRVAPGDLVNVSKILENKNNS